MNLNKLKKMRIRRAIKRVSYHTTRRIIIFISYFNHRLHMKLFIPLLKKQGMKINGVPRYIGPHVRFDDFDIISLGHRVVISDHCTFLTHDYSLTTALIAINEEPKTDQALIRGISVGNNVFIGKGTIIMPNTRIGDNIIVGAGSVVRGVLESNSIYLGNPVVKVGDIETIAQKWKSKMDKLNVRID